MRRDFSRISLFSEYYFLSDRSALRSHGPGAITNFILRNEGTELETYYLAYWWNYAFRSGAAGWLEVIVGGVFVVLRFTHAVIHITDNNVPRRFFVYSAGFFVLLAYWLVLLVRLGLA